METIKITFSQLFGGGGGDPIDLQLGESAYLVTHRNGIEYYRAKVPAKFAEMVESILPSIANEYCYIGTNEDGLACERTLAKMWTYAVTACDGYIAMLDYYEKAKGKLMQAVRVREGASDMPQSSTLDMLETSESKNDLSRVRMQLSDGGTLMTRLSEIQEAYRDIMDEWANDYIGRFVIYE